MDRCGQVFWQAGDAVRPLDSAGGLVSSDALLSALLDGGMSRAPAYDLVKEASRDTDAATFEHTVRSQAAEPGIQLPADDYAQLAVDLAVDSKGLAEVFDRLGALA